MDYVTATAMVVDADPETALPVSEQFGPTLQGEGPYAGQPVQFLRLGGCNLSCSWCDTAYTWDASQYNLRDELTPRTGAEIAANLISGLPLVISGGEPLLHQDNAGLRHVLAEATDRNCPIHVETNGTIKPSPDMRVAVSVFAVSPKLAHAGKHRGNQNPQLNAYWPLMAAWHSGVILKVVVRDGEDVGTVARWAAHIGWPKRQVWVMPLGTTTAELLKHWDDIASAAAEANINATQRLHILAWGDVKGT